jgi:DNA mismatch repair protein MutL
MSKIRVLPDHVANQIAAGEVVERPVAVVKELVENSLDAGATRIHIAFRKGGKLLIRVEDNGCGMVPDDALLCLERHATSKINEAKDLQTVHTFGFRGEAVPSIASVSRFTLRTRSEGWDHGTEVFVNGGKLISCKEVGMAQGTTIEVANLFNSVPVRRKFLKTDKTEAAHIVTLCRLLAIAHPEVSFTLMEDDRVVFRSPVCRTLKDRVAEIYGRPLADNLVELDVNQELLGEEFRNIEGLNGMRLYGLMGKPGVGRSTRQEIVFYVNQRPIDNRTLNYSFIEAYHGYLPSGRYPVGFLFLEMPTTRVDVNVHPAKREVRFSGESNIRRFVMEAVMQKLRSITEQVIQKASSPSEQKEIPLPKPVPPMASSPKAVEPSMVPAKPVKPGKVDAPARSKAAELLSRRGIKAEKPLPGKEESNPVMDVVPSDIPTPAPVAIPVSVAKEPIPERRFSWRFLGVVHGRYVNYETPAGLVLLHRSAARRRILYETYMEGLEKGTSSVQGLLFPITLELDSLTSVTLQEHIKFFNENGFTIEHFGGDTYRLSAIPEWFDPDMAETFVRDILGVIRKRGMRPEKDKAVATQEFAKMAAAKAAQVREGDSAEEMEALARRLLECRNPLTDPQGKPTYFELGRAEIEKRLR